jgi:hypothetical protein
MKSENEREALAVQAQRQCQSLFSQSKQLAQSSEQLSHISEQLAQSSEQRAHISEQLAQSNEQLAQSAEQLTQSSKQLVQSRRRESIICVQSQLESKSQVRKVCDKINLIYKKSIDDGTIGWQPWNASLVDNNTYQSTVVIFFEGIPKVARHLGILYRYPSQFEDWTDRQIKHAMDLYLADLRVEYKQGMKYWAMVNTMAHMAEGATKI